jgi:4-amino-4-deoxy-L-arabinose transferase-like glycosyltransferase
MSSDEVWQPDGRSVDLSTPTRRRSLVALLLLTGAIPPAYLGHRLLMEHRDIGWSLSLAAVVMVALATRLLRARSPFTYPDEDPRLRRRWRFVVAGAGCGLIAYMIQLKPAAAERHVLVWWFLALALVLVPFLMPSEGVRRLVDLVRGRGSRQRVKYGEVRSEMDRENLHSASFRTGLWLRLHRVELAVAVLLFTAALAFRLPYLERFPAIVHNDEADCGLMAQQVLDRRANGEAYWFRACDGFFHFPSMGFFPGAAMQAITGTNLYGNRLANVVLSIAALLCLYSLTRSVWGPGAAAVATGIAATAHTALHWSRDGIHSGHATWLTVICAWLAWKAVSTGRIQWFVLLGFSLAICLQTYTAAYLVPVWLGLVLLACWTCSGKFRKRYTFPLLISLLSGLLFFGPMIAEYQKRPATFFNRANALVWSSDPGVIGHMGSQVGDDHVTGMMKRNLGTVRYLLHDSGDSNLQYGVVGLGMVDRYSAIALVLGTGVLLAQCCHFASWPLLFVIILNLSLGAVFTIDGVQYSRIAGLALVVVLVPTQWFRQLGIAASRTMGRAGRWLAVSLIVAAMVLIGLENFRIYFVRNDSFFWTSGSPRVSAEQAVLARHIRDWGSANITFVEKSLTPDYGHHAHQFISRNRRYLALDDLESINPASLDGLDTATFVVRREDERTLQELQVGYPGGSFIERPIPFYEPGTFFRANRVPIASLAEAATGRPPAPAGRMPEVER